MLYQPVANLQLGRLDVPYLLALFREAEHAGVVNADNVQILLEGLHSRHIRFEQRFIIYSVYERLKWKISIERRLRNYRGSRLDLLMRVILSAIINVITVKVIVQNAVSGGSSIFDDVEVARIVSILGNHDPLWQSNLVDTFLQLAVSVFDVQGSSCYMRNSDILSKMFH